MLNEMLQLFVDPSEVDEKACQPIINFSKTRKRRSSSVNGKYAMQ